MDNHPGTEIKKDVEDTPFYATPIMQRILKALNTAPMTVDQLVIAACTSRNTLVKARYLRKLHLTKIIHVYGWQIREWGKPLPIYAMGDNPDAERPEALSRAQRIQRWRDRTDHNATQRFKRLANRSIKKIDPCLGALLPPGSRLLSQVSINEK